MQKNVPKKQNGRKCEMRKQILRRIILTITHVLTAQTTVDTYRCAQLSIVTQRVVCERLRSTNGTGSARCCDVFTLRTDDVTITRRKAQRVGVFRRAELEANVFFVICVVVADVIRVVDVIGKAHHGFWSDLARERGRLRGDDGRVV